MSMATRLVQHFYRDVGLSKTQLSAIIDEMDTDLDGKVSLAEVAAYLRVAWAEARAARKAIDKETTARTREVLRRRRRCRRRRPGRHSSRPRA